jgi:putative endopeptidase
MGAPSNLPAFAAAFQCKPGDAMVRGADKQVVIW